ncbi:hypothetical protein E1293_38295 [Actinomadura darangshiensis]|uniref:Uncharacterized protein n=1 Tax=Actinomadura darangshiensis TaxID=705336 RepID=A0A4R5ABT9_9ACTN|nr:hypothetical protein [Actinomadura darangshiensis]TDD67232.1 hypothetical protein E1293_38295 [Actinomadura darangshiensis]
MPPSIIFQRAVGALHQRLTQIRDPRRHDAGYTTEVVVVTALLIALGIAAVAVIAAKVRAKASGLDLG